MSTKSAPQQALSATSAKVIAKAFKVARRADESAEDAVRRTMPGLRWTPARGSFPALVQGIVVSLTDAADALSATELSAVKQDGGEVTRTVWHVPGTNRGVGLKRKADGSPFKLRTDRGANTGPEGALILVAATSPKSATTPASKAYAADDVLGSIGPASEPDDDDDADDDDDDTLS